MKPINVEDSKQSDLEKAWDFVLNMQRHEREIIDYIYEPFKLILVPAIPKVRREMVYTPDFLVVKPEWFEIHEVKSKELVQKQSGARDGIVRVKMSAERFPWFKHVIIWSQKGQWVREELN